MNGGIALKGRGFTIIEVMIVLAVTMAMFLSAVALINGKQHNTAFNQSIRAIQGQFERTINEVGSGYYTNDGTIKCEEIGGKPVLTTEATDQGSNKDCLFMGKILQFGLAGSDRVNYNSYTLVGLKGTTLSSTFNLETSQSRVIARAAGEEASDIPDLFQTMRLQYGLTFVKMYYGTDPLNDTASIGFVSNLTSIGAGDGSQRVDLVAFPGTEADVTGPVGVKQLHDTIRTPGASLVNPTGGISACFAGGGVNQSGLITVGGASNPSAVELKIFNNRECNP